MAAVLHHAARRGLCPYTVIDRPKQPKGRERWLTPKEAEELIDACAPHLAPLVTFILYTGARLSEALHLDWDALNLPRRRVAFLDTKNGTHRGVPLHSRAFEALANLPHRDGAVFRCPAPKGQKIGPPYARRVGGGGQISTAWLGACRRSGFAELVKVIEDKEGRKRNVYKATITPHDLRHTWATWFYAETRDLRALMELGGWKSMAMVLRYAHVNPDHLQAQIDSLPGGAPDVHLSSGKVVVS